MPEYYDVSEGFIPEIGGGLAILSGSVHVGRITGGAVVYAIGEGVCIDSITGGYVDAMSARIGIVTGGEVRLHRRANIGRMNGGMVIAGKRCAIGTVDGGFLLVRDGGYVHMIAGGQVTLDGRARVSRVHMRGGDAQHVVLDSPGAVWACGRATVERHECGKVITRDEAQVIHQSEGATVIPE